MNKTDLGGVAHRGTACFGIVEDGKGHLYIGGLIYINMADTRAGLDARHLGIFGAGPDESCSATGDEQIYIAHRGHKTVGALARGIVKQVDYLAIQIGGGKAFFKAVDHCGAGAV